MLHITLNCKSIYIWPWQTDLKLAFELKTQTGDTVYHSYICFFSFCYV